MTEKPRIYNLEEKTMTPDELRDAIAFQVELIKFLRCELGSAVKASPTLEEAQIIEHLTSSLNHAVATLMRFKEIEGKAIAQPKEKSDNPVIAVLVKAQDLKEGMMAVFTKRDPLTVKAIAASEESPPTYKISFHETEDTFTLQHDQLGWVLK